MTEEERERLKRIRERLTTHRAEVDKYRSLKWAKGDALRYYKAPDDVDFLLSLLDSQDADSAGAMVDDTEPLTDAQVDAWLQEHKDDSVDPARANRVEWLFRKKLAASIVEKAREWLRYYDERIAQGGKGAQDMERLYGKEAAFHRDVIRAVETLALEPLSATAKHSAVPRDEAAGWLPIETCPDNTTVLFWDNGPRIGKMEHNCLRMDDTRQDHFWGGGGFDDNNPPTHWMPLPLPPAP